jgi:lipopolysaccharide/colanic/teichoic acid biosynthesis glycosyltransferase
MSLVGPRPVPPYEAVHYRSWQPERFSALPGITGLWQVQGRCLIPPRKMAELDAEYVRRQSLALDFKILFRTIPAVISGRGAG